MLNDWRELAPAEKFHSYMAGWKDAVNSKLLDSKYTEHHRVEFRTLYEEGYKVGREALYAARNAVMARFGYEPVVLRKNVFDE